ncbi:MAG: peptidoglycan binding domain-containing protein, partial [Thermoleophilia bacterium]
MQTLRPIRYRNPEGATPRPHWQFYLIYALAIVVVFSLAIAGFALAHPGVLPGTTLDGVPLGGLSRVTLTEAVASYAERTGNETIAVRAVTGGGVDKRLEYTRKDLGFAVDQAATVELVWRRGRQLNPVLALADHVRALVGRVEIRPVSVLDDKAFELGVASAAAELDSEPIEAHLEITGATVSFTEGEPGMAVDRAALAQRARGALEASGPQAVEVPAEEVRPENDPEELAQLARQAERAVSGPIRLTKGDAALELSGEEIGHLLSVADSGGRPRLYVDPAALEAAITGEQREALESDPANARIRLSGGAVVIDPAEQGFRFGAEVAARQVVEVATSEPSDGRTPRQAELVTETLEPDFTTADAQALQIVERVSSFTTEYPAGQSRVQNIHRIADLVDGVVLRPGEQFSINGHVGPRT